MSSPAENLSAYLDGELTAAEIAALESELAGDAELRAELEALEGAVDFMRSHGPLQAPAGFADAVLSRVSEEAAPAASNLVWLRRPMGVPIEALAVAAAAVLVLVFAMTGGTGSETSLAPREVMEPTERTGAVWAPPQEADENAEGEAVAPAVEPAGEPEEVAKLAIPRTAAPSPMAKPRPKPKSAPVYTSKEVEALGTKGGTTEEATDEIATGTATGMTVVPFSYTLSTEDPEVLKQLDVLARRYGGRLETAGGGAYAVASMNPGTQQVFVRLPNTQMANFGAELRKLGEVHLADANDMVASSEVTLEIRVDYEPGTTGYAPQMQKAAPKKK